MIVPIIFFEGIDDIDGLAGLEEGEFGGEAEADAVHEDGSLPEGKADMLFLNDAGPGIGDIAADEDGLSVARAEGLHLFDNIIKRGADGVEGECGVDDQFREQRMWLTGGGYGFFKFYSKGLDLVGVEGNAGGGKMSAISQ